MGWAKDAFENELAKAGIFPIREQDNYSYCNNKVEKTKKSNKVKVYYQYDFPTEAQIRALNFITTYTGIIFEGSTKKEARDFISEYIEYAREEQRNDTK